MGIGGTLLVQPTDHGLGLGNAAASGWSLHRVIAVSSCFAQALRTRVYFALAGKSASEKQQRWQDHSCYCV